MNIWYEGHLAHPKKCSGMHFWGLETCSNTKFLKSKKKFFSKIWGSKKCKITFLKKTISGKNSYRLYLPDWRNLGPFGIWEHTWKIDFEVIRPFLGIFLGVERRKSLVGSMLELCHNSKNILTKNVRCWSISSKKNLRCATKTRWDILKNFLFFPDGTFYLKLFFF